MSALTTFATEIPGLPHKGTTILCPGGKVLKLEARRYQRGNNLFGRYEADCRDCPLREHCFQLPEAQRKHLAISKSNHSINGCSTVMKEARWSRGAMQPA